MQTLSTLLFTVLTDSASLQHCDTCCDGSFWAGGTLKGVCSKGSIQVLQYFLIFPGVTVHFSSLLPKDSSVYTWRKGPLACPISCSTPFLCYILSPVKLLCTQEVTSPLMGSPPSFIHVKEQSTCAQHAELRARFTTARLLAWVDAWTPHSRVYAHWAVLQCCSDCHDFGYLYIWCFWSRHQVFTV